MKLAWTYLLLAAACGSASKADDDNMMDPMTTPDAAAPVQDFCNATDPRAQPIEVVATPEAGEAPYLTALQGAQSSIDLAVYEMGYGGILDQLTAKAQAGVPVRVILDTSKQSVNQKYFDQLAAAGAQVKWSSNVFTYYHAKYFVVDHAVAVISTGNYSKSYSIDLERNFVATDRDAADVADIQTIFEADWAGVAPTMDCTRMVFSPINSRDRVLAVIEGAQHTLDIESMQFADTGVRDAVKARIAAGVQVRALLAEASWITANADAAKFLQDLGVTVKSIPHLHTKVLIADGTQVYMGSENFSYTSLNKNREVGVVLVEPSSIAPLVTTYEQDWAVGTSF